MDAIESTSLVCPSSRLNPLAVELKLNFSLLPDSKSLSVSPLNPLSMVYASAVFLGLISLVRAQESLIKAGIVNMVLIGRQLTRLESRV